MFERRTRSNIFWYSRHRRRRNKSMFDVIQMLLFRQPDFISVLATIEAGNNSHSCFNSAFRNN